jgi:Plavaka transposase
MYCPIILGSDKTTVSVATGQVEYHPLYISIGNPHNTVRRAHRNAVIPIAFLAIPKSVQSNPHHLFGTLTPRLCILGDRGCADTPRFRTFKRQLYHASVAAVLRSLRPGLTCPVVRRCPDGHFRRVIYDLVAFIADYPEQVLLTGIVQGWCAK